MLCDIVEHIMNNIMNRLPDIINLQSEKNIVFNTKIVFPFNLLNIINFSFQQHSS